MARSNDKERDLSHCAPSGKTVSREAGDQSGITLVTIVRLLCRRAKSESLVARIIYALVFEEGAQWIRAVGRSNGVALVQDVDPRGKADNLLGFRPSRA